MFKRFLSHCTIWLFVFTCRAFGSDEPRLYSGTLDIPTLGELEMSLGISESDEGTYVLLTVPKQGAKNLPLEAIVLEDGSFEATLPQANLTFVVKENADQTRLVGHMEQGLMFPLDFERVSGLPELHRPQHPIEPYPYLSREVTALHPDGHLLAGTLTIPEGRGPFPCAVLISGSGMQDRDETIMGHKPFLVIADDLTKNGIAVLRFDDRGVGGSVVENWEDLQSVTSEDFATDAAVMVDAARMHPEIDSKRVGVIGHSEGGLIGPMVAVEDEKLAFVVMLAGPGVSGQELLPVQQALLYQSEGADPTLIDSVVHASMSLYELIEAGASQDELREQLKELVEIQLSIQGTELSEEILQTAIEDALKTMTSPWLQFFLFHDPAPVLARVQCPVLALNGTLDVQVSFEQNLPAIEEAMLENASLLTVVQFENLNHLFQPATTGAVSEYGFIETTIDPIVLEVMNDWVSEVTDVD